MSALTHSLATLWSRFRWEVLGYWALVALSCLFNASGSGWTDGVTSLQALALYWITFRIVLSEAGFSTHGGWRARPFAWNSVFLSQVILLLGALIPSWIAKAVTLHQLLHPTSGQWLALLQSACSSSLLPWLYFVLSLKAFEYLMLRQTQGRGRKVVWALMVVVLVPVFFMPASKLRRTDDGAGEYSRNLFQGIQRLLPDASDFIGGWYEEGAHHEVPQARLLARYPVAHPDAGTPGFRVLSLKTSVINLRSSVTFDLVAMNRADIESLVKAIPVLAFTDGSYGAGISHQVLWDDLGGIAPDLARAVFRIEFASPLLLPENRELSPARFSPAEVLFFVADKNLPFLSLWSSPMQSDDGSRPRPLEALPANVPLDLAVRQVIDSFDIEYQGPASKMVFRDPLPQEAMPVVLAYHPWSDLAWKHVISPFLQQQVTEGDKPALLKRLSTDPRLTQLFIDKGWAGDALPVLRQRARERLPLDAAALPLLAREEDPALNADLAALIIRLDKGTEAVAKPFRENPAFDWRAFVAAGWKSRKYGDYDRDGWLYALWAAELGDATAFRRLAEKAAVRKKWEGEQLPILVAGNHEDLTGYLRENIDRLRFDAGKKQWILPD